MNKLLSWFSGTLFLSLALSRTLNALGLHFGGVVASVMLVAFVIACFTWFIPHAYVEFVACFVFLVALAVLVALATPLYFSIFVFVGCFVVDVVNAFEFAKDQDIRKHGVVAVTVAGFVLLAAGWYCMKNDIWWVPDTLAAASAVVWACFYFNKPRRFTLCGRTYELLRFFEIGEKTEVMLGCAKEVLGGVYLDEEDRKILTEHRGEIPAECPGFYAFFGDPLSVLDYKFFGGHHPYKQDKFEPPDNCWVARRAR